MGYIGIDDDRYPPLLRMIKDPPERIYYEGRIELLQGECIAVVGSRNASNYGKRTAFDFGKAFGNSGLHVVSGMAYGIDMEAHRGAVETEGSTIAVLGSSIDMEKAVKKKKLFDNICEMGLVISEYPPGTPAYRYSFPRRNRIISGISSCTVVVEAGFTSGSLITAELAAEQGRNVLAVPGNIDSPMSLGTNRLIRDGATPILSPFDVVSMEYESLGQDEILIMNCLRDGKEKNIHEVSEKTGFNLLRTKGIISALVIKGMVQTDGGRIFVTDDMYLR